MLIKFLKTGVVIFSLCMIQNINAQYATEIFIPLGQSPGLSGVHTTQGIINAVNLSEKTISLSDSSVNYELSITSNTQIWLDQSQKKLNNKKVALQDLRRGMLAEVKYIKNEKSGPVEWIKVKLE